MNVIEYPDQEMLALALADELAGELENALLTHDHISFAVPGGTSPGPIFDTLCAVDLDWSRITVMASDERWVPMDDPASNARLIKARLLQGPAAAARFLPFFAQGQTPVEAAAAIGQALPAHLPLSLLFLGMGADMHTASLFPGAEGLAEALDPHAPPLCALQPPGQPMPRISLSAPVLAGALSTHVVIYGDEKRRALETARHLPLHEAPIGAVLGQATIHWAA